MRHLPAHIRRNRLRQCYSSGIKLNELSIQERWNKTNHLQDLACWQTQGLSRPSFLGRLLFDEVRPVLRQL